MAIALATVGAGNHPGLPSALFAGQWPVEGRHLQENPESSPPAKVIDASLLGSVDSREFHRFIAPGVRIIGKQSAVLHGGSRSRCRPKRVNVGEPMGSLDANYWT